MASDNLESGNRYANEVALQNTKHALSIAQAEVARLEAYKAKLESLLGIGGS